jgi:hypothetical protein
MNKSAGLAENLETSLKSVPGAKSRREMTEVENKDQIMRD